MNRLVILVVLALLGMASVSGPTMAVGVATSHVWTVTQLDMCLEPEATVEAAPAFRPCAKKVKGLAVACQPLTAVLPVMKADFLPQLSAAFEPQRIDWAPVPSGARHFRPPQAG